MVLRLVINYDSRRKQKNGEHLDIRYFRDENGQYEPEEESIFLKNIDDLEKTVMAKIKQIRAEIKNERIARGELAESM